MRNVIRIIRFIGIVVGAILLFVSINIIIFSSGPLKGTSLYERAYSFIPYLFFAVMLLLPYRFVKPKFIIYICNLIFIIVIIGTALAFYRALWYSIYPSGSVFEIDIPDIIPIVALLIFILNYWAFFQITKFFLKIKSDT